LSQQHTIVSWVATVTDRIFFSFTVTAWFWGQKPQTASPPEKAKWENMTEGALFFLFACDFQKECTLFSVWEIKSVPSLRVISDFFLLRSDSFYESLVSFGKIEMPQKIGK